MTTGELDIWLRLVDLIDSIHCQTAETDMVATIREIEIFRLFETEQTDATNNTMLFNIKIHLFK